MPNEILQATGPQGDISFEVMRGNYGKAGELWQQFQNDKNSVDSMIEDNTVSYQKKVANILNSRLDASTKSALMEFVLNEESAERANQRSLENVENYYPNLVKGLQKAGLNPFLALQSLGGSAPSSSSGGISAAQYANEANARRNNAVSIGSILAIIAAAVVRSFAFKK